MKKRIMSCVLAILMILTSIPFSHSAKAAGGNLVTITIYPEADASVSSSNATKNYGTTNNFSLKKSYSEEFMRYDLSSISGFIVDATMVLTTITGTTTNQAISILSVSNDTWVEGAGNGAVATAGELTWGNKPAAGSSIGSFTPTITTGQAISINMTSAVTNEYNSDKKISMTMQSTNSSTYTNFNSKEATLVSNRPKLVITVDQSYVFPSNTVTTTQGQQTSFSFSKTASDGSNVVVSASNMPNGATLDAASSSYTFNWTPDYSQLGNYNVTFVLTKGSYIVNYTVGITVNNDTSLAVFNNLNDVTTEPDKPCSFTVSATSPTQGVTLAYTADGLPTGATLNSTTGAFNWTPSHSQIGTYNITFHASGTSLTTANKTITIIVKSHIVTIYPEADASVSQTWNARNYGATNNFGLKNGISEEYERYDLSSINGFIDSASLFLTTTSSSSSTFNLPINIVGVSDDTWVEGTKDNATASTGELTWSNKPTAGTFVGNTSVVVPTIIGSFTPSAASQTVATDITSAVTTEYNGDQKISMDLQTTAGTYTYFNSKEATDSSTRPRLEVTVDQSYVFPSSSVSTKEGQAVSFTLNKQTIAGENVDLSVNNMPSGASFDKDSGVFSWTPDYSQAGNYKVTIMAKKQDKIASYNVNITVSSDSNAPDFTALKDVATDEGKPVSFTVSASNPSQSPLKYSAEGLPQGATFDSVTGAFNWTPSYSQSGTYNITFGAGNDLVTEAKKTIAITVNNINWPLLSAIDNKTVEPQQELSFSISAIDPEGGTVAYQVLGLPYGATFDSKTGYFRWVPDTDQLGQYTIGFTASNKATSPVTNIQITVTNTPGIVDAADVYKNAEVGYKTGAYFQISKDKLQVAIAKAEAIKADSNSTQEQIAIATADLQTAVTEFKNSVIKTTTGDTNNDGKIDRGDLLSVLSNYSLQSGSGLATDFDGNGKVGLEDLVFVAKRISLDTALVKRTFTILPTIDTRVRGGTNSANAYYWLNKLDIRNAGDNNIDTEEAFIKFDVSKAAIPGTVVEAKFYMNSISDSTSSAAIKTDFVSNDAWTRDSMTYASKPSSSEILGATDVVKMDSDGINKYSVSIPGSVLSENSGDGILSLRVYAKDVTSQLYSFTSLDGVTKDDMPRIVVTAMVAPTVAEAYDKIMADLDALKLGDLSKVTGNLNLTTTGSNGTEFKWESSDEQIVTNQGIVKRPKASLEDKFAYLTLTTTNSAIHINQKYRVTVLKEEQSTPAPAAKYAVDQVVVEDTVKNLISSKWNNDTYTFTNVTYPTQVIDNVVTVNPGENIQAAIDTVSAAGGGVVLLKEGTYIINSSIIVKSRVTLVGEGEDRTILKQGPSLTTAAINVDSSALSTGYTDIVLKDFTLEGVRGLDVGVGVMGVLFSGKDLVTAPVNRVMLQHLTIKNWSSMGMHLKRTSNIIMDHVTATYNGESNSLYHNLYFLFVNKILQSDCDFSSPAAGKGAKYTSAQEVIAQRITINNCIGNGIQADNAGADHIIFHKYSITNCGAVAMWFPCENYTNKFSYTENPIFAPQSLILSECNISNNRTGGIWRSVRNTYIINSVFNNLRDDLELLNCDVKVENSTFNHDQQPIIYKSVFDLPDPII